MATNYWKKVLRMFHSSSYRKYAAVGVCTYGALSALYLKSPGSRGDRSFIFPFVKPAYANSTAVQNLSKLQENERKIQSAVGARGRRFIDFATVVVNNELYMTPKDFLESVIQEYPKPRFGHQQLSCDQAREMVAKTPPRGENSIDLFRDLNHGGLISYTEYLFLLCVITKPKAGFEIAFKMFDTDDNRIVDKQEFLVLGEIFEKRVAGQRDGINNSAKKTKRRDGGDGQQEDQPQQRKLDDIYATMKDERSKEQIPTTLQVHFFGEDGTQVFNYEDFFKFMDNLQTEILEMEFLVYSHGMNYISEEDFARILLRFTDEKDTDESIERLRKSLGSNAKGISFPEFRNFFQFVNNLEDFAIALRLYALAGRTIGQADFTRAVKVSTGLDLSENVVNTIFLIFDSDGDDKLSHVEFLGVMKDRAQRGFRRQSPASANSVGLEGFKTCVSKEFKIFLRNLAARTQPMNKA